MAEAVTGTVAADILCTHAFVADSSAKQSSVRVFGLSARERLERTFLKLDIQTLDRESLGESSAQRGIVLSGDYFYDERLVTALAQQSEAVMLVVAESGRDRVAVALAGSIGQIEAFLPLIGSDDIPDIHDGPDGLEQSATSAQDARIRVVSLTDLVPAYDHKLRKLSSPYVLPVDSERARETEGRIFAASYKGATDFVTKYVWPVPARIVTRWCANRRITPNMVTGLSYVLTFVALVAFWRGDFGIGLVSGWMMTFLDTVDGKLARVTLTSTKLGDVLDHGLDLVHPPFWWAAWAIGLKALGDPAAASVALIPEVQPMTMMLGASTDLFGPYAFWVAVILGGYVLGRLLEGVFILAFGQEMFIWRPFDFAFRLVIARRNPNLVMLTVATIVGRPDLGFVLVGVWTLVCLAIQCVRIGQAGALRLRGQPIRPFAESM